MPAERLELKPSLVAPILLAVFLAMLMVTIFIVGHIGAKLFAVLGLAGTAALCVGLARRRLVVDDDGLTARGMFGTTHLPWHEVDHYTYWSMNQEMYAAAGVGGGGVLLVIIVVALARLFRRSPANRQFTTGRLTIIGRGGGKPIVLDNRYRKVGPALDRAFGELHDRLRGRADFAPFALGETELRHARKGVIALADIAKVNAANARLAIRRRGKRLAWVRMPMRKIKNVMLLVEELAERGLVIDAKSDVFVPPPVLAKLRAAASRQAALPTAKLVQR